MAGYPHRSRAPTRGAQRGQAIIFTVVLIALGVLAAIYTTVSSTSVSISNRQSENTAKVLLEVKQVLIGWSVGRDPASDGTNARPGELPCPDINPLDGYEDGSCVAGALGRVPWKTLRIPEPKDAAGETLWYTVAGSFRKYDNSTAPITSSTLGDITVYQDSTATTLTTQAVAVIFAAGAPLGTQDRSSTTTMTCSAPSGTYTRNVCAENYLETVGGVNNATINGPFIRAQSSSTFNDRLQVITNVDLMPVVEQRVAREIISLLNSYRTVTGIYPWADLADGDSNGNEFSAAYNRNRFPCGNALPTDWDSGGTPKLPNWLTNGCWATGWTSIIYYAVARNRLKNSGTGCTTCSASSLTVNNPSSLPGIQCTTGSPPTCTSTVITAGSADLVLITPGAATANPHGNWPTNWSAITGYFEDGENSDNDNSDDTYVVPTSTLNNRDRIFIVR